MRHLFFVFPANQRTTTTPPPPVVTKAGYVMGCSAPYKPFQGNCFALFRGRLNWATAKTRCHYQGANLATINNREEQNFVMTLIPKSNYIQRFLHNVSYLLPSLITFMFWYFFSNENTTYNYHAYLLVQSNSKICFENAVALRVFGR